MNKDEFKEKYEAYKDKANNFWQKHKCEIKRTAKVSGVCMLIGFLKGIRFESANTGKLIDRIPKAPDLDDLDDYLVASGMSKVELEKFISELADNDLIPRE